MNIHNSICDATKYVHIHVYVCLHLCILTGIETLKLECAYVLSYITM